LPGALFFNEFGLDAADFSVYRQVPTDEAFSRGVASRVLLLEKTMGPEERRVPFRPVVGSQEFSGMRRIRRIAMEETGTGCRIPSG
jgi:hypothetical protein